MLHEMGKIGALPGGGCCRLALTEEDCRGRDLFVRWCQDAGCDIQIDAAGNVFARRRGRDPSRPAVATGSHLDTQPHAGLFDGIYGVLAGLEVFNTLNDSGIETQAPLEVIVWTNEEGVRFMPPSSGAQVFAGKLPLATLQETPTSESSTVAQDLRRGGYLGAPASLRDHRLQCLLEAHIEQGPILEQEGLTIGVVTGIQAARLFLVEVSGRDGHAGTVPMDQRRDALVGAAEMVAALNALARSGDPQIRLTVGRLDARPNSSSTIAGAVEFHIDLRHPSGIVLDDTQVAIERTIDRIARNAGLTVSVRGTAIMPPVDFDAALVDRVQMASQELQYPWRRMLSGAGHDAGVLAPIVPTAMIFVPCKDGVSHNEAEMADPGDLAAGANVLMHAMLSCAE